MYSLLIVDDDIWVRRMLLENIAWNTIGISYVRTAENGQKALHAIAEDPPQIILSDVKMDGMDGITLLDKVKSDYPDICIILLSAFDKFSYVQAALKKGAFDYILKPAEESELLSILSKAIDKIANDQRMREKITLISKMSDHAVAVIKENALKQACYGNLEEFTRLRGILDTDDPFSISTEFVVGIAEIDKYRELLRQNSSEKINFKKDEIKAVIYEHLEKHGKVIGFYEGNRFAFFFGAVHGLSFDELKKLRVSVIKNTGISVTLACSEIGGEIKSIAKIYQQASDALKNKFYRGNEKVLFAQKEDAQCSEEIYLFNQESVLRNAIISGNTDLAVSIINNIFEWFNEKNVKPFCLKLLCVKIMGLIGETLHSAGVINTVAEDFSQNKPQRIDDFETMHELRNWMHETLFSGIEAVQQISSGKKRKIIEDILKYIDSHYSENISLDILAHKFLLNPVYLSRLFKAQVGKTFTHYLTDLRIRYAKEFLADTSLLVYMISDKVGYCNEKYFYKIFKEVEGITPTEYRDKIINTQAEQKMV